MRFLFIPLAFALLVAACKRPVDNTFSPDSEAVPHLLKKIDFDDLGYEEYTYNSNRSLIHTNGASPGAPGVERGYSYSGKKLEKLIKSGIREEHYEYNENGGIRRITEMESGNSDLGMYLDFEYNSRGRVSKMTWSQYDGATITPKRVSVYTWNDRQQLVKIVSTIPGQPEHQYILDLTPAANPFYFSPWAFIDRYQIVYEDFELYNLPVLSGMDRLPVNYTRTFLLSGTEHNKATFQFIYTTDSKARLTRRVGDNYDMTFTWN